MKILFYFGHPAQYLFLRETMLRLIDRGHKVKILIKSKDVLEKLLSNDGFSYTNILKVKRGNSMLSIALSLLKRNLKIFPIVYKFKPDLLVGTDATIAQIGKLLSINRVTILEDDYDIIKTLAKLTYPFTQTILCPVVCKVGKWNDKKIGYAGYMKLAYLHPNVFIPDESIIKKYHFPEKYVIIRIARLTAHHDIGIKGISDDTLKRMITSFKEKGLEVFLSAEGQVQDVYKPYLLHIDPTDMHNVLSFSSLLVCDSQSMSVEAAMLGVPSLRFSSFAGKISVLEELENKYQLTFGINPEDPNKLFEKLDELLELSNLHEVFQKRRKKMLKEKIDVSGFLTWFIENYPKSVKIMKENPDYQYRFK